MVFASIFVERIFLNFSRSSSSEKGACGSCGMWSFSGDEEMGAPPACKQALMAAMKKKAQQGRGFVLMGQC
jgi:hypothetical protein